MKTDVKFFEVRDEGTHIPVMVTMVARGEGEEWQYQMRRAGWGNNTWRVLFVTKLNTMETQYDEYNWKSDARTMPNAHRHIISMWDTLVTGDVIDVEYILGDSSVKKISEEYN